MAELIANDQQVNPLITLALAPLALGHPGLILALRRPARIVLPPGGR
ncbi:MAG: hypothetical protein ACJ0GY_00405 [Synechococcus sp.]|jgi:hypothetical protein|nr:hypothetical protein [Synechococcus sp. AH-779-G23]MBC8169744.1 hypothetical protein [Synechococcus sp.]MBL6887928.1 hypothetical protein [Synechococcus sp. BS30m-G30]MDA9639098.1 hypothetical protein [Synechococcus sp. AH-779-G23]